MNISTTIKGLKYIVNKIEYFFSAREAAIWELEKQQLHEKHQLAKSQLKDMFFLKRHQMLTRHQKVYIINLHSIT